MPLTRPASPIRARDRRRSGGARGTTAGRRISRGEAERTETQRAGQEASRPRPNNRLSNVVDMSGSDVTMIDKFRRRAVQQTLGIVGDCTATLPAEAVVGCNPPAPRTATPVLTLVKLGI
jgi:hypothetical protein